VRFWTVFPSDGHKGGDAGVHGAWAPRGRQVLASFRGSRSSHRTNPASGSGSLFAFGSVFENWPQPSTNRPCILIHVVVPPQSAPRLVVAG